jgi:hypothetical protein
VDEGLGAKKDFQVVFCSELVGFIGEIRRLQNLELEGANP